MAHIERYTTSKGEKRFRVRWIYYEPQPDGHAKRVDGKRTFRDEAEAKAFRIAKDVEISGTGRASRAEAGKETVAHWAQLWLKSKASRKPSTLIGYRRIVDGSVVPLLGNRQIRSISPADVDDFILAVAQQGKGQRSAKSIRHHYGVLAQVLKYARRREAIPTNPAVGAEIPSDAHDRAPFESQALTEEEVQDLAEAMRQHAPGTPYPLLVEFMAYTGLRAAEVAGLTIGDVRLPAGQVHVKRTLMKRKCTARCPDYPSCREARLTKDGKPKRNRKNQVPASRICHACRAACDDGECCWVMSTPKNRKPRVVDLPTDWLCEDMAAYLVDHPYGPNGDHDTSAPLWPGRMIGGQERFAGAKGGLDWKRHWWRDGFYQRQFRPAATAAGFPKLRLHDLRHTAGSILLDKGMQPVDVAAQLGHSLDVFTRIYAHQIGHDPQATRARFGSSRPVRSGGGVTRLPLPKEA